MKFKLIFKKLRKYRDIYFVLGMVSWILWTGYVVSMMEFELALDNI